MNYIYVLETKDIAWDEIKKYIKIVSEEEQRKILSKIQERDRCHGLAGKMLLLYILKIKADWKEHMLPELRYNKFQKPFINKALGSFNISHSGDMVVCFYSREGGEIGIDIEKISEIEVNDFNSVLTKEELSALKLENKDKTFFKLWTQKESLIKADGRGLYKDLKTIKIEKKINDISFKIQLDDNLWNVNTYSQYVKGYMMSSASLREYSIQLEKISLDTIKELIGSK